MVSIVGLFEGPPSPRKKSGQSKSSYSRSAACIGSSDSTCSLKAGDSGSTCRIYRSGPVLFGGRVLYCTTDGLHIFFLIKTPGYCGIPSVDLSLLRGSMLATFLFTLYRQYLWACDSAHVGFLYAYLLVGNLFSHGFDGVSGAVSTQRCYGKRSGIFRYRHGGTYPPPPHTLGGFPKSLPMSRKVTRRPKAFFSS